MYDYSSDSPVLSVIARGRGLLEGGVELDCIDTGTAYSLSGKPFLESTPTGSGRSCKPLRTHKLALPKTYITRRGAMVLFTAPEDMVIGQACNITEREAKSKPKYQIPEEIISRVKTTSALKQDVLGYNVTKYEDSCTDVNNVTQPGHFTNVYLESLQRATEQSKLKMQDCEVEDIEIAVDVAMNAAGDEMMIDDDKIPTDGRDSGIGQSAASSSIPSVVVDHLSSGAPSRVMSGLHKSSDQVVHKEEKDDILNLLKSQITDTAARRDKASKSKKPKSTMSTHTSSKKMDTSSKKKLSTGTGKKLTKKSQTSKRKVAAASVTEKVNDLYSLEDATTHSFVSELAVLPQGSKQSDESSKSSSSSKNNAEHKRALLETKRLEKQELEEERVFREKENVQLQAHLDEQRQKHLQQQENTLSKIKYPYITPGQVSGLATLERQKVIEEGLELSVADETLNEKTDQRDREVDQLLQRAKNVEATFIAGREEHERQQKIKKEEEQKELIALEAKKLSMENEARRKLEEQKIKRELHNKAMNMDLLSCRMYQGISRPWTYSYFQYVPTPQKDTGSKKRVTKTRSIKKK